MKAKACARCRQCKLRCDSDVAAPAPCSRCRAADAVCIVDTSYQRISKTRRLVELEAEVARLRQQNQNQSRSQNQSRNQDQGRNQNQNQSQTPTQTQDQDPLTGLANIGTPGQEPPPFDFASYQAQPQQPQQQSSPSQLAQPSGPAPAPSSDSLQTVYTISRPRGEPDLDSDSFHLSAAQVTQCFRTFFLQCHQWLEFSIPTAPEAVYAKHPLLFWVICAVSSSTNTMLKLQPGIEEMIGKVVVNPPRSVETVQALLILCIWPFPFYSTLGDPSFVYCGIATQIGLQLGLHKPGLSQEFSKRKEVLEIDDHVRNSTWMACYIVSQTQTARLGLRHTIQADFSFLNNILEAPEFANTSLLGLCRLSRFTAQFTSMIGADARNLSGLVEPFERIGMVKYFVNELETLQKTHLPKMSRVVELSFLTSRLQLLSFALHDDIPQSSDVIDLFYQAELDASTLILTASESNLSRCPFHLARSVLYAALVLIKIVASPYSQQPQVIFDQITLASRTLSTAVKVPNDHAERWSRHLQHLIAIRDFKRTPSVRSRMSASLIYDTIRVLKEHLDATSPAPAPEFPGWMNPTTAAGLIDLDGLNWDSLGDML